MTESTRRGQWLDRHLRHIERRVVPRRGAAQRGMAVGYLDEVEARAQPPLLVRGIEQWNAGQFYEQHETLEFLWRATDEPVRDVFKGIIQSGVGAYHALKRNRRGALAKWTGALGYLAPFEGRQPYGIDISALRGQVAAARDALLADEDQAEWEGHAARLRALRVVWEPRPAEPVVTGALAMLDRRWDDPLTGLGAVLRALPPAAVEGAAPWALWAASEKAQSLRATFGVEAAPLDHGAEWRLAERWLEATHQTLRATVGFMSDADWRLAHAVALARLVRTDEAAAAALTTLAVRHTERAPSSGEGAR